MADPVQEQLVANVSRDLVAKMAPQELPLFRAISAAYFTDAERMGKDQPTKDELLGFGAGPQVTALTPIVLAVTSAAMTFLAQEILKSVGKSVAAEGGELVSAHLKHLFKRLRPTEPADSRTPSLTREQLAQVRRVALEKARSLSLPAAQAEVLAGLLVADLAVAPD